MYKVGISQSTRRIPSLVKAHGMQGEQSVIGPWREPSSRVPSASVLPLILIDSHLPMPIDHLLVVDFEATCDEGEEDLSRLEQNNQHEIIEFVSTAPPGHHSLAFC